MKWLIVLFSLLSLATTVSQAEALEPEYTIVDPSKNPQCNAPLCIICRQCGATLYECSVDEILPGSDIQEVCKRVTEEPHWLGYSKKHTMEFTCPYCGVQSWNRYHQPGQAEEFGIAVFTNKGWMPRRIRPTKRE